MSGELFIGFHMDDHGAPARLLARKLNRHTFWCGQSGSGKTYALGVLLEQVVLETALPLVVLDPNSDFVHLGRLRDDAPADMTEAWNTRDVRVFGNPAGTPLKVRFLDMPLRSRAACLQIDPIQDADEYNAMLRLEPEVQNIREGTLVDYLRASDDPVRRRLALRLENLSVDQWSLWAWRERPVTADLDDLPDATVIDLGGFDSTEESSAAALAVLDHLWAQRERRIGRLIVIDEAHHLCSPDPASPIDRLLTERVVQIAAEGRKYGLWMLLSTQRPGKIHPNALSQCDNLALMRLNASRDVEELARIFGYAPAELLRRAIEFGQGEALFAGGFVDAPTLVHMGARLTREGGVDVPVPLR